MLNASPTAIDFDVYQPRNPKASGYYLCVEDHFEQLETVWDDRYQSRLGFWRPYVTDVIRRYLASGSQSLKSLRLGEIAGIYISVLRVLNAKIVDTNICWRFHANVGICVPPAIRSGWWNSANGYAQKC
jgi:hypothetical protein